MMYGENKMSSPRQSSRSFPPQQSQVKGSWNCNSSPFIITDPRTKNNPSMKIFYDEGVSYHG